jgi:hypothetical protein
MFESVVQDVVQFIQHNEKCTHPIQQESHNTQQSTTRKQVFKYMTYEQLQDFYTTRLDSTCHYGALIREFKPEKLCLMFPDLLEWKYMFGRGVLCCASAVEENT